MEHQASQIRRRSRVQTIVLSAVALVVLVTVLIFANHHFSRPRGEPTYYQCTSHLHQIGLGILLYQNDHGGKYPDDFGQLFTFNEGKLRSSVFICYNSSDTPATGTTVAETARNFLAGGHCSYVYLGKGMTDKTDPNAVVAYDPPEHHDGMIVVLFADGHADVFRSREATALMAKLKSPATMPTTWP